MPSSPFRYVKQKLKKEYPHTGNVSIPGLQQAKQTSTSKVHRKSTYWVKWALYECWIHNALIGTCWLIQYQQYHQFCDIHTLRTMKGSRVPSIIIKTGQHVYELNVWIRKQHLPFMWYNNTQVSTCKYISPSWTFLSRFVTCWYCSCHNLSRHLASQPFKVRNSTPSDTFLALNLHI